MGGGDPRPAVFTPLGGEDAWSAWTPRAFAYTAQQAQDLLRADLIADNAVNPDWGRRFRQQQQRANLGRLQHANVALPGSP